MNILLFFFVGITMFCIGVFIGKHWKKTDGMFIVNDSDVEVTRWTLDVNIDPKTIPNKKEIRLKVVNMIDNGDV